MATFCNATCKQAGSICDFCGHYDFNGNGSDGGGGYTGEEYCNALDLQKDPADGSRCKLFICFRTPQGNKLRFLRRINKEISLSKKG